MAVAKTKTKNAKTVAARRAGAATTNNRRVVKPKPAKVPKLTRRDQVIAMLKRPSGYTAAAIGEACGLLEHSVRALISNIGKDNKVSTAKDGKESTVYFIKA